MHACIRDKDGDRMRGYTPVYTFFYTSICILECALSVVGVVCLYEILNRDNVYTSRQGFYYVCSKKIPCY